MRNKKKLRKCIKDFAFGFVDLLFWRRTQRTSFGVLECWSVGVLECWSVGVLEFWSVGVWWVEIG